MKKNVESFDDIVFEDRNKEYGAYELRRRYSKRGAIALSISIFILFTAVGVPLIASMMNKNEFLRYVAIDGPNVMSKIDIEKVVVPPPLPPPAADLKEIKFVAPIIVDSLTNEEKELATTDELISQPNTGQVDTTSQQTIVPVDDKKQEDLVDETVDLFAVQEKPAFPGGDAELLKFVGSNTKYPVSAMEAGIQGTVHIRFVVAKNGSVGEAKVLRPIDPLLEEEALRVIKSMPKWTPGKNNGNPVNVWFIIPVKFVLN